MIVGALEAENNLSMLLDRVEHGEEIVITRHGKPVARLIPSSVSTGNPQARAALERMRSRTRSLKGTFDWPDLKVDRETGRP